MAKLHSQGDLLSSIEMRQQAHQFYIRHIYILAFLLLIYVYITAKGVTGVGN